MSEIARLLWQIEAQCRFAHEAILDEHEADLLRAVEFVEADAEILADLVREM